MKKMILLIMISMFTMGYSSDSLLNKVHWSHSITPVQKAVLIKLINNMVKVSGGTALWGEMKVTLSDYYIGKYEVTQAEWKAVMGYNPSHFKGDNLPVESVSWEDCQVFVEKLNALTGLYFRLPTQAESRFASSGGNNSKGYAYSGSNTIDKVAWYKKNSEGRTHIVGTKAANELGLFDMSGNVYEWTLDIGAERFIPENKHLTNPIGFRCQVIGETTYYYCWGGSWNDWEHSCMTNCCSSYSSGENFVGFRLVIEP